MGNEAPHNTRGSRRLVAVLAVLGTLASIVVVGAPANAANVDLVVNVSTAQSVYAADANATYSVRVDNRGTQDTSVPSTVTLTVPNTQGGTAAWEQSVTCVASAGAVCPSAFTRSAVTVTATIPSIAARGHLVFTVIAPGVADNQIRGRVAITATVAPQSGDVELAQVTNESSIVVLIVGTDVRYSGTATGPDFAAAETEITYDVVVSNDGVSNSLRTTLALSAGQGSGVAATPPVSSFGFTGLECVAETTPGLCANVRKLTQFGSLDFTLPNPIVPPPFTLSGTTVSVAVINMPAASAVTLRFTADTGRPACNTGIEATRLLTLTNTVTRSTQPVAGQLEAPLQLPDNSSTVLTNLPAAPCVTGDLAALNLSQPMAQASSGTEAGNVFSFTATYTNLGGSPAIGARTMFTAVWPGTTSAVMSASATCVATGGAVCPTSYTATGATVRGVGAQLPVGGSIEVTYTGTAGAGISTVCRPLTMLARTSITPPVDFLDTNWVPNGLWVNNAQSQGNNARQISSQANIGSPCADSHDDAVQQTGPFTDAAATVPLVGPVSPGDVLFMRSTFTSQSPARDLTQYTASGFVQLPQAQGFLNLNDPDRAFRAQAGDPSGLPYADDDPQFMTSFDTGVRCEATGGAVCPPEVRFWGGASVVIEGWRTYWKPGTQPPMPAGGTLSFITSYKVPPLTQVASLGGCIPNGLQFGGGTGNGTATTATIQIFSGISNLEYPAATDPASPDRNQANDTTVTNVPLQITRCPNSLQVTKTALTPQVPLDRTVEYRVVASNPSGANLDMPRIIDAFSADAPATIECTESTGGALCPGFQPQQDVRYLSNGTTGAITFSPRAGQPPAQFDFTWGTPGAPTMPPGSSVTFIVTVQYADDFVGSAFNQAIFGADASATGPWPTVSANASVTTVDGIALMVSKSVETVALQPGQETTFTVDVVNNGPMSPSPFAPSIGAAYLVDSMDALFAPTNPLGFQNLQCRPLVAEDGVLDPGRAVGATPCPAFVSDAAGIRATIPTFARNSGFRITYSAVAPLTSESVPNVVTLRSSPTLASVGDSQSQVNVLTVIPSDTQTGNGSESLSNTGVATQALPWGAGAVALLLAGLGLILLARTGRRRSASTRSS